MTNKSSRREFFWLLGFLLCIVLLLTNGFAERIFAQKKSVDVYEEIGPIGDVLAEIMKSYVEEPEVDKVVEGALIGMMRSLDKHCSYLPPKAFQSLTEDTQGEFDGIGVHIKLDDNKNLVILQPIPGSPAADAGILPGDFISEIDGTSTRGMSTSKAADLIKGPRGETVHLVIVRFPKDDGDESTSMGDPQKLEFDIKRGKIPDESISEARIFPGNVGYIRISDFRRNTAKEIRHELEILSKKGMKALILDLRWNPGGLLRAPISVCELFLEENSLVTYTRGRPEGNRTEDRDYRTERKPEYQDDFPLILLVNENSASSSEILTGALQYYARALVLGQKTYGKGTVQEIVQLQRPKGAALRLTTAKYYTPADVTIDSTGIQPDVEVKMSQKASIGLWRQLYMSFVSKANMRDRQDHGNVFVDLEAPEEEEDQVIDDTQSDSTVVEPGVPGMKGTIHAGKSDEETIDDIQLAKALKLLNDEPDFNKLIAKHHKSPKETQVASPENGGPQASLSTEETDILDENGIPERLKNHN